MSLDVYLTRIQPTEVYWANITHNLGRMAEEAGIYKCLWRPSEIGITKASQLIEPLADGIKLMELDPTRFKKFDAANGWGIYNDFIPWLKDYLAACIKFPDADINVST